MRALLATLLLIAWATRPSIVVAQKTRPSHQGSTQGSNTKGAGIQAPPSLIEVRDYYCASSQAFRFKKVFDYAKLQNLEDGKEFAPRYLNAQHDPISKYLDSGDLKSVSFLYSGPTPQVTLVTVDGYRVLLKYDSQMSAQVQIFNQDGTRKSACSVGFNPNPPQAPTLFQRIRSQITATAASITRKSTAVEEYECQCHFKFEINGEEGSADYSAPCPNPPPDPARCAGSLGFALRGYGVMVWCGEKGGLLNRHQKEAFLSSYEVKAKADPSCKIVKK